MIFIKRHILLLATLNLFLINTAVAKGNCNIVAALGGDFPPYIYENAAGEIEGTTIHLFKEVISDLDCSYEKVENLPSRRLVNNNKVVGTNVVLGLTPNELRKEKYFFSTPFMIERVVFAYKQAKLSHHNNIEDVFKSGLAGAMHFSGYYGEEFEQLKKVYKDKLVHTESSKRGLKQVNEGYVDFFIGDEKNLQHWIKQLNYNEIQLSSFDIVEQEVSFAFLKSSFSKQFVTRFDTVLREKLNSSTNKSFN